MSEIGTLYGGRHGIEGLTRLREDGPEHAQARKPLPFGLSSAELAAAHKDLARPVPISTAGLKLSEALDKIAAGLDTPLNGAAR